MIDATVVEQQIPQTPEASTSKPSKPPEVEKPIGPREAEMAQEIKENIESPDPDPDKALREIAGEGLEINKTLTSPDFTPKKLVDVLKESFNLKELYESPVGVWEGYSLEEHTLMMMGQFERYFSSDWDSSLVSKEHFRLMLALHDLGKPQALKETGSVTKQHEYTMRIVPEILQQAGLDQKEVDILKGVINQDFLGDYFKNRQSSEVTAKLISERAQQVGVPAAEFINLLRIYYMCDAGSYTVDAGGKRSLDELFIFDRKKGKMAFSQQDKINKLLKKPEFQKVPQKEIVEENSEDVKTRKQEIREFTRSTEEGRAVRRETAQKIINERKVVRKNEHKQNEIKSVASKIKENIFGKESSLEDLSLKVAELERKVQDADNSLLRRILYKVRPALLEDMESGLKNLRQKQEATQCERLQLDQDYINLSTELARLMLKKDNLRDYKKTLKEFYELAGKEYDEHRFQEFKDKEGQVKDIALKHGAYFVHGLQSYDVFSIGGTMDRRGKVQGIEQVKNDVAVIAEFSPTVSTSSIRFGREDHVWYPIGVIIGNGVIQEADQWDFSSEIKGVTERSRENPLQTEDEYREAIETAINRPDNDRKWNEITIKDSQIAGLYIDLDHWQVDQDEYHYDEVFEAASEFQMQVFVFKDGIAHEATLDPQTRKIVLGKEVNPSEMTQKVYKIPEEKKERIVQQARDSLNPLAIAA